MTEAPGLGAPVNGNSSFAPMTDYLNAREAPPSASEMSIDAILGKQGSLVNQGSGIKAYTHGAPSSMCSLALNILTMKKSMVTCM